LKHAAQLDRWTLYSNKDMAV